MLTFDDFFEQATGGRTPYPWQREAAKIGLADLIDIPTGWGKTEGVVVAWAWRRFVVGDVAEPRRLAYCLPMRVLVRQTAERLRALFDRLREGPTHLDVPVFTVMGGDIDDEWAGLPDRPWVLVGTQDQLLSRALNRGYAMSRFHWPVHFGLLNNDCRWIVDEVQLLGPGLWTTAQLDWMRRARFGTEGPCPTTWMSATLGPGFLDTVDRRADGLGRGAGVLTLGSAPLDDGATRRHNARRPVEIRSSAADLAEQVVTEHADGTLSLVVCNTVASARAIFDELPQDDRCVLITSRFRAIDRAAAEQALLDFERLRSEAGAASVPNHPGLICVSTQVIEAGVDVSAHRLWSEIAPWPSVVQRLGRLNRDGHDPQARATFWYPDTPGKGDDRIGPYEKSDVDTALSLLKALGPLSTQLPAMEALARLAEGEYAHQVAEALAPRPAPMPRAYDIHGLFSTDADLHGGFTDVSEFVRNADPQADVTVVWRDWTRDAELADELEGPAIRPLEEGCPVRASDLRSFLKQQKVSARHWDDDRHAWRRIPGSDLRPGMVVMVPMAAGGYDGSRGWTGDAAHRLAGLDPPGPGPAYDGEPRSELGYWCGLTDHLADAAHQAEMLLDAIGLDAHDGPGRAVVDAARLHDLGKAHPVWQAAIPEQARNLEIGDPLAKWPRLVRARGARSGLNELDGKLQSLGVGARSMGPAGEEEAWAIERRLVRAELGALRALDGVAKVAQAPFRPGLRHEAATALAMWARYRQGDAPWSALAVYLAAAHHGKVRTTMRSRVPGTRDVCGVPFDSEALTIGGESWPLDFGVATDGADGLWTDDGFQLTGCGWTALVADLLGPWRGDDREPWDTGAVPDGEPKALGPFRLAYLEALVQGADWRASDQPSNPVPVRQSPA